jgi:hypothetical protein
MTTRIEFFLDSVPTDFIPILLQFFAEATAQGESPADAQVVIGVRVSSVRRADGTPLAASI